MCVSGREHYDPFQAIGQADAAPTGPALATMNEEQQAHYLEGQLAAHSHQLEQQHHAAGHPLLRGDTSFSAQAKDEYVQRMAARTSDDMATLQAAMKVRRSPGGEIFPDLVADFSMWLAFRSWR